MLQKNQSKALLLSSLGGMLEFYDFIIYALLASYISKLFFPIQSAITSLLITFSAYAVGYLARPFGGIIFGHFGDKYGRKKTFTISILIMALSTFIIGILPTYSSAGIIAPILLVLCRVAQGVSIGGEIPGAVTYVGEIAPYRQGFVTGTIFCFLISGMAIGFIVESLLLSYFNNSEILSFGWRIPFILGGIFGLIAYYLRRQLIDIKEFNPFVKEEFSLPITKMLLTHSWNLIYASIIVSFGALCFVTLFLLLPAYFSTILNLHLDNFTWVNSLGVIITSILCVVVGLFADKINKTLILFVSILATFAFSFIIYIIYTSYQDFYFIAIVLSGILVALCWGNIPAMLIDLFKQDVRYTGIGFAYNLGFAVFGGLTPMIVISAIKFSNNNLAPAYILTIGAIITLIAMIINKLIQRKVSSN
ncbi:MFS transporter [Francisella tularensis subsp. novicida]|uniref:MFS transporter n=1 Tax=Francisella tularensis TaxID=263 RepID=UPI000158ACC4|nr:MFS transporter [Francisella tularensis]AJI45163.1 sugar (and other) transporter family protein [Francisella tularensis subsp. novicida F6168]AJJ47838.1 sugar (and other) transporter family protein [Francisella tularensis subsp. novicida]APC98479.1 sugar (and other) transporter family protein [Francisella tularensis subsp. novicida]EDN35362.1 metabolite:H+ symporter family protein [Francisella tularensis subsp. novicida GA99-3549]KFJ68589.1 sugar (and other) transporter family protein [Fran